ncbi:MAG: amidohydrolase family protein [Saprospirales bacterium]|nr:amidohydrolase family protein [Saprospirales bacterium]
MDTIRSLAQQCRKYGLQLCVHAIGDRANREVLDIYASPPQPPHEGGSATRREGSGGGSTVVPGAARREGSGGGSTVVPGAARREGSGGGSTVVPGAARREGSGSTAVQPAKPLPPPHGGAGGGLRWRIEHAQHIDPADFPRFRELGVIAAMQAIHCTSDAPFVVKRLGETRARSGAYAWRSLLDAGAFLANGTDAPVEDVDPLPCIYAAVSRKRADTGLAFFTGQKMVRHEALLSYTLWNAYAAFEEHEKGSLMPGKRADIIVLNKDLLHCSDAEILQAKVTRTYVGGRQAAF